jgi:hypothetical protein
LNKPHIHQSSSTHLFAFLSQHFSLRTSCRHGLYMSKHIQMLFKNVWL